MPGVVGIYTINTDTIDDRDFKGMCASISHKPWHIINNLFQKNNFCCASVQGYNGNITFYEDTKNDIYYWLDGDIIGSSDYSGTINDRNIHEVFEQISNAIQIKTLADQLSNLNGFFSLTIYDKKNSKLFLCSDIHGLRHIYYYSDNNRFIFSSEQKAIFKSASYSGSISKSSVDTFIQRGYLENDITWFEAIHLLPPATILELDLTNNKLILTPFYSFTNTITVSDNLDFRELILELGKKFVTAVSLNIRENERVGIGLSGGLDSRALLAACNELGVPTLTFTFGSKNSEEIHIAKKVAKAANVEHEVFEINSDNWLKGRREAIIYGEGVPGFENLQNVISFEKLHDRIDVKLDGFLGDATIGGSYLNYDNENELELIYNRGRRRIISGPKREMNFFNVRLPFFEKDFYNLSMSIPEKLRRDSYIYRCMLLERFPKLFRDIPALSTGLPINNNISSATHVAWSNFLRKLFLKIRRKHIYIADYSNYIRVDPGRSFVKNILFNKDSEFKYYLDSNLVQTKFNQHMSGDNHLDFLGKVISLELWLQYIKTIDA
jgi:asparagine synthase (glutamine-hydrolysing)